MKTLIAAIVAMAISLMAVVAQVAAYAAPLPSQGIMSAFAKATSIAQADRRALAADAAIALGAHDLGLVFTASAAGVK
ncbi:hypothetical protein DLJ53_00400 [Acuticoccus sediminis]|uniref:Uncharacterized protein n=1 Tax=Acuticoccus sediminis TaxID=2184697 RepID=A0A8B2NZB1_9HYPH|nr:hypothetical protein [Acuticoccus sediminis]RAI03034.1 hypothetical protein DLJ53_00400 [Acuticoccus sediminis]